MTQEEKKEDSIEAMINLFRAYKGVKEAFCDTPSVLLSALTSLLGGEILCLHQAGIQANAPDFVEACADSMKMLQGGPVRFFVDKLAQQDGGAQIFEQIYKRCLGEIDNLSLIEAEIDNDGNLKVDETMHHDDMVH